MSTFETVHEPLEARDVILGRTTHVRRVLPNKSRRMIGAWCFLDHYGPDDIKENGGMWVPPHPHTGLQTVTWLFEGTRPPHRQHRLLAADPARASST